MDDDGDMAEMYLTEKKQRMEVYSLSDLYSETNISVGDRMVSKSAPVSPVGSINGVQKLQRAFSSIVSSSKHGSLMASSTNGENIDQLEMLLEAYFVVIDNTLSKLLSVIPNFHFLDVSLILIAIQLVTSSKSSSCYCHIFFIFLLLGSIYLVFFILFPGGVLVILHVSDFEELVLYYFKIGIDLYSFCWRYSSKSTLMILRILST